MLERTYPESVDPKALPVSGSLHQLKLTWDPTEQLRNWAKEYGNVFQIMMGSEPVVVFNSNGSGQRCVHWPRRRFSQSSPILDTSQGAIHDHNLIQYIALVPLPASRLHIKTSDLT